MKDLNKHQCIGRMGKDPELKYMPNGKAVVNFSVACGNSWKDQNGVKQERTTWINYVAFDKPAEIITQYCKKGSRLFLEGELTTREYTDNNQTKRTVTEIRMTDFQLLDGKQESSNQPQNGNNGFQSAQQNRQQPQYDRQPQGGFGQQSPQQAPAGFDDFDDLPF